MNANTYILNKMCKILLNNNIQVIGSVVSYDADNCIVKSSETNNLIIINDPNKNIILIKITEEIKEEKIATEPLLKEEMIPNLQLASLVELRKLQIKREKEEIAAKLTSHTITDSSIGTNYECPRFFKNKSSK